MKKALSLVLTLVMLLGTLSAFSVLSVSAAELGQEVSAHTGEETNKPAGSGTELDPYLIATAEHLRWIQQGVKQGDQNDIYGIQAPEGVSASYVGVYFEQVCDIDLNGATLSDIGYYVYDGTWEGKDSLKTENCLYVAAFGGTYNGNGYSIKNGTIKRTSGNTNQRWACGLFGVIYGATLKNIVLEDLTIDSNVAITGALVGLAYAPAAEGKSDFNRIENCVVKDSVTIKSNPKGKGAILGGLVGRASGTTIIGCVNEAQIDGTYGNCAIGGIVGDIGNGALVENCINKGTLRYVKTAGCTLTSTNEVSFGGIIGCMFGDNTSNVEHSAELYSGKGSIIVRNCYNSGGFQNVVTEDDRSGVTSGTVYWGGIAGTATGLPYVDVDTISEQYVIENCHNTAAVKASNTLKLYNNVRIAGILSNGYCQNKNNWLPMTVKNCYSVEVDARWYSGTNEVRMHNGNASTLTEKYRYAVLEGANAIDDTNFTGTYTAYAVFKTNATKALTDYIYNSTTVKFQDLIDEIDANVAKAQHRGATVVSAIGYQASKDNATTYRVVMGLNSLRFEKVGVEVSLTLNGQAAPKTAVAESGTVYTAVKGFSDEGETVYEAKNYGVSYLNTLTISDVAATGTSIYTIRTYTVSGEDKTFGDVIVLTFENGTFQSAVLNPVA